MNARFRNYAAPLLSQLKGVSTLTMTASVRPSSSSGWECFRSYYRLYPDLSYPLSLIYDLNEQACNIYTTRVLAGPNGAPLTELVQTFKNTLETFPSGAPGEHVLVWATFIAASASVLPEHQQYFTEVLLRHHRRNGFANIPTALEQLRRIWARRKQQDWTKVLPKLEVFIV